MDRIARRFGHRVFPEWALHPSQIAEIEGPAKTQREPALPEGAFEYLSRENPRLLELRRIYGGLHEGVRTPLVWTDGFTTSVGLALFRGDNLWINQLGGKDLQESAYVLATYYALAADRLGLMQKLTEDGVFGAMTLEIAGRTISRDLLDSVLEIDFLSRHLPITMQGEVSILDIGAGYGRLAHRMACAFPTVKYLCTDAIAESTFVCEYYMRFRGLENKVAVLPATEIVRTLKSQKVDLAINVHSFSECTLQAVGWWLNLLARHSVKYLMIVPNAGNHGGQLLLNNKGQDMLPAVEESGYRLTARESKYMDPFVQKWGMNPTYYWLFELQA